MKIFLFFIYPTVNLKAVTLQKTKDATPFSISTKPPLSKAETFMLHFLHKTKNRWHGYSTFIEKMMKIFILTNDCFSILTFIFPKCRKQKSKILFFFNSEFLTKCFKCGLTFLLWLCRSILIVQQFKWQLFEFLS